MKKTKTPIFESKSKYCPIKHRYLYSPLTPSGQTFSACCGSTLGNESASDYYRSKSPSGRGIGLFPGHEPKELKHKNERQYNINTVNGPISFVVRHNKEPKNGS
jgi:hypothetical protein